MKNKIYSTILLTVMVVLIIGQTVTFSESNNVGELKKLLDDIIVYNMKSSGSNDTGEWLAKGAGGGTDFYTIALRQLGTETDFSLYKEAISNHIESDDIKSAVTKQKNALAMIAVGNSDSQLIDDIADTTVGVMGIMSYIYGLHLLNNGAHSESFTAESIADILVSMQFDDGGWAISGKYSDVDVTAMTIQALAPNINGNDTIAESVERAISFLSEKQLESGGFQSYGTENPESSSQVIIALTSMGIDPLNDERFIKNGKTLLDGILKFHLNDGSFCHTEGSSSNGMSTYQAFLAIASIIRFYSGSGPLFLFEEITEEDGETVFYEEPIAITETDASETEENSQNTEDGNNINAGTDNEHASEDQSWKTWTIAAIISVAAVLTVVCIIKKQKTATYIILTALTAAFSATVLFTDIQTPENYYGKGTDKDNIIGKVTIQIRCDLLTEYDSKYIPKNGEILTKTEFDIEEGDTVYDILVEAVKKNTIHIETTGPNGLIYVNGINHLYEFDYGDLSGWIYTVNGEIASVGCSQYVLKSGDDIIWQYTMALGTDLDDIKAD